MCSTTDDQMKMILMGTLVISMAVILMAPWTTATPQPLHAPKFPDVQVELEQRIDPIPPFHAVALELQGLDEPARTFQPVSGSPDKDWILEVNGNGLAIGDFDGSGSNDLVVVDGSTLERIANDQPGFAPRMLLNDGAAHFREGGASWAMAGGRWGTGAAAGDVDNDGDLDLVVLEWGPDRLFENLDGKGLRERTEEAGFQGKRWATSAAFLDYDEDGCLDLAVVNYLAFDTESIPSRASGACKWKGYDVMCGPEGLSPVHDQLYRGKGDGTFEDVTRAAGFVPSEAGYGLGVTTLDFDADGDTDLYVTNDSTANFLWENQGDGKFQEVGMMRAVSRDENGKEQAGMGVAAGDVDGDGLPELLVTNFSGEHNAFYQPSANKKSGRVSFKERSFHAGIGGPSLHKLGWGTAFFDADLDGELDAFVLNGHVYPQASQPGTDTSYAQTDDFYRGGAGNFTVEELHDAGARVGRAGAAADLDGDGRLEVVALRMDAPIDVLHNQTQGGHWLMVRAIGTQSNRDGIGARIQLQVGERRYASEIRTAGGYQASIPALAHFGLGAAERVDRLVVHWPSGATAELADVAVDQLLEVREPEFEASPANAEEGAGR